MAVENDLRSKVVKLLRCLDARPCENSVDPGTPDVHHLHGWIELKKLARWPRDELAVVRVDHYTPQQRTWAKRRILAGGRVDVLVQIGTDFLLFDGRWAAEHLGRVPRSELETHCLASWAGRIPQRDLIALCRATS